MYDLISRQAAIDAANKYKIEHGFDYYDCACEIERDISNLPSAQPEPRADAISRQEAVEAIEEHASCVLNSYPYEQVTKDIYDAAHRHIIEVINSLPTA